MPEIPEDVSEKMAKEFAKGLMDVFITPTWIPVGERLPEPYASVLFIEADDGEGALVWLGRNTGRRWVLTPGGEGMDRPVTHWMPCPEPPTDVTEQT